MSNFPAELQYQSIRPRGWYSRFKQWPIQPLSSNTYWNPSQIIRFNMMLNKGVMDPYRSHIVMKVTQPKQTFGYNIGALQIDNSAQSFIEQLVVSSRGIQRQRINQYDVLAAYLTDIGFSEIVCEHRQAQGLGYTNYEVGLLQSQNKMNSTMFFPGTQAGNNLNVHQYHNGRQYFPSKVPSGQFGNISQNPTSMTAMDPTQIGSTTLSPLSSSNYLFYSSSTENKDNLALVDHGYLQHMRCQYNPQMALKDHIDVTATPLTHMCNVNASLTSALVRAGKNAGKDYNLAFPTTVKSKFVLDNGYSTVTAPNTPQYFGYEKATSHKFSIGTNEPFISNTIPQCQFGYGLMGTPVTVPTRKFSFPLLSSIIGALIPPDQFVLLPLEALYECLIQLTLSPYAMFTSGYKDQHQYDLEGMSMQQKRNYQIAEIYYNLHIYEFDDVQLQQHLKSSLTKEIAITGSSWMLSSQYNIQTGNNVRGNWQINCNAKFLGQIVILYVSNEYMRYSFCRKQFRLSNNIRSIQYKFNTEFFPSQPITGNSGNPIMIDNSEDNSQFLHHLMMSNNYKFVTNVPQPRINSWNFAINGRCYSPANTSTFFRGDTLFGKSTITLNEQVVNTDTALGYSWWHQNRMVGRAAFGYTWEPYGHSRQYMIGIDASLARPFEVLIDTWQTNAFPSDQTMLIYTRANTIITYSSQGINVLGR